MATNSGVTYDDKLLTEVETELKNEATAALAESDKIYDDTIGGISTAYEEALKGVENYKQEQTAIQNEQTDLAIKEVEQKAAQTEKDYLREQKAAHTDYQKATDPYGVNAEKMAASGLSNTGYAESSKVAMYNQYQVRMATARESFLQAKQNYDSMITSARVQNNAALAKIAYDALVEQTELAINYAKDKNALLLEKTSAQKSIKNNYWERWQAVLDQIYGEESGLNIDRPRDGVAEGNSDTGSTEKTEERKPTGNVIYDHGVMYDPATGKMVKVGNKAGDTGSTENKTENTAAGDLGIPNKIAGSTMNAVADSSAKNAAKVTNNNYAPLPSDAGSQSKESSKELEPDMKSIRALGLGMISAKELNDLIAKGIVIEYEEGGKLKYRLANGIVVENGKIKYRK